MRVVCGSANLRRMLKVEKRHCGFFFADKGGVAVLFSQADGRGEGQELEFMVEKVSFLVCLQKHSVALEHSQDWELKR